MENEEHDKKREWLSDLIKVSVLIWSASLLTASYVRLPSGQKILDFDPTFIASVFSGSLAGFGIAAAKNAVANGNNSNNGTSDVPIYSAAKRDDEEESGEPKVRPVWTDEPKNDGDEEPPLVQEGYVKPRT